MRLLLDTSALLATTRRADRNHAAATRFARQSPGAQYVVSDLIVSEVATRLRANEGAARAVATARDLLAGRAAEVVFVDREILSSALSEMERFADKRLSLTDCVSFVLMGALRLDGAFTFDDDFRRCGFAAFP